jgi:hypothetical protein
MNLKIRLASAALAATLATSAFVVVPTTALATTKDIKVVENQETGEEHLEYDVQKGDTLSQISVYLVNRFWKNGEIPEEDIKMFKEDPNTKCRFWTGIVYYYVLTKNAELEAQGKKGNVRKLVLRPDKPDIPVPSTYEELKFYTAMSKKTGFHAAYCKANHIYSKPKTIYIDKADAIRRSQEVFRTLSPDRVVEVSDKMLATYLKMISGVDAKFVLKDGAKPLKGDDNWRFYELVLYPEEVEAQIEGTKTK